MKLSEFLQQIGRPVAYFPRLAKVVGGVKQAILIGQLIYWCRDEQSNLIYKTSDELEEETGLTYAEQKVARGYLKQLKIIKDRYARLEHTVYFEIDFDRLNDLWERSVGIGVNADGESMGGGKSIGVNADGESNKLTMANAKNDDGNKEQEITRKITEEEEGEEGQLLPPLSDGLSKKKKWEEEDRWLTDFLAGPLADFIPGGYLDDPAWWEAVGHACGGLAPRFINVEFAKMKAHLMAHPEKLPMTRPEWMDFVWHWLCRTNEAEKKNVTAT